MTFNETLMGEILTLIESRTKFVQDGLSEPQSFDFKCYISLEELFELVNKTSNRYTIDEFKYCIGILKHLDYIRVSNGSIIDITLSGIKFIMSQKHKIEYKY